MHKFRYVMRGCFGFIAALHVYLMTGRAFHIADFLWLALAVPSGVAWWTLKRGKGSGRHWAIAGSVVLIVIGTFMLLGTTTPLFHHDPEIQSLHLVLGAIYGGSLLASGIAGLIAFWPKDSVEQMNRYPVVPPREFQTQSRVKRFVCWGFGGLSLVFALLVLKVISYSHDLGSTTGTLGWVVLKWVLLLLVVLTVVICCGMAWWTVRNRKPSGRRWAISASTAMLLMCVVLGIAEYREAHHSGTHAIPPAVLITEIALLFFGVAGLVAFAPRDAMLQVPVQPIQAGGTG